MELLPFGKNINHLRTMKSDSIAVRRNWRITGALLRVAMLLATGCNCVNVQVGSPVTGSPGWQPPSSPPPPSGGNFVPTQCYITGTSGTTTICNSPITITKKHANFYPPSQAPNPGENAFRGYVFNATTSQIIANSDYVLQAIVDINTYICGTPVANSTTDVTFPAVAGTPYKIAAHFKPNKVPAGNPQIVLYGSWIVQ